MIRFAFQRGVWLAAAFALVVTVSASGSTRKTVRGLEAIAELSRICAATDSEEHREHLRAQVSEIEHAIANNHRRSIPDYVDLLQFPFVLADALHNPIAKGMAPPSNVLPGETNPPPSTFWNSPTNLASADLQAGFGRTRLPNYEEKLWTYAAPKKSGRNPGCEVKSGKTRLKVKFAEVHSEPFIARVFHALGFNVDPTDFTPGLQLAYDRRFFTEFNSREPMRMKVGILRVPLYRFDFQPRHDPFAYLDHAVLDDGTRVSPAELRTMLLGRHRKIDDKHFRPEAEGRVARLVTVKACVQEDSSEWKSIGPWGFDQLGHERLRELRGAGLAAAWVGWGDSRLENTRLKVRKTANGPELKHFFSDLGGGLGRSPGALGHSRENAAHFRDSISRRGKDGRFQITGFETIDDTRAFRDMTPYDARWMVGLIAQLTEAQIRAALEASGFNPADVEAFTVKLLSRRAKFLRDLE